MIFYIILFLIILAIIVWGGVTQWKFIKGKGKEGYEKDAITKSKYFGNIINKLEDYVIIRLNKYFPYYKTRDDVDILTNQLDKNINIIKNVVSREKNTDFNLQINGNHLDFYKNSNLVFKIDMYGKKRFQDTKNFKINSKVIDKIIKNRISIIRHGIKLYVPRLKDDLAIRYMEYIEKGKEKIKHLNYVNTFNIKFPKVEKNDTNFTMDYNLEEKITTFIIWPQGMKYILDILKYLNEDSDYKILMIKKIKVKDFNKLLLTLYSPGKTEMSPTYIAKKNYMTKIGNEIFVIFFLNTNNINAEDGSANTTNLKWKIRSKFNKGKGVRDYKRRMAETKDMWQHWKYHVVHNTKNDEDLFNLFNLLKSDYPEKFNTLSLKDPYDLLKNPDLTDTFDIITTHIKPFSKFEIITKDITKKWFLSQPCHKWMLEYIKGNKKPYIDYYLEHAGNRLTENHAPSAFDKLIQNFNHHTYNFETKRLIIWRNHTFIDGSHRLALLINANIYKIKVLNILD